MELWQKRWFDGDMPLQAKTVLDRVFTAKTVEEAKSILKALADVHEKTFGIDKATALIEAKKDIGYIAGYGSPQKRDAIEKLFDTEHPVFGRYSEKGSPNAVDAYRMGLELGRKANRESGN